MGKKILCLNGITKKYPGVIALQNVSLSFDEGEVHAIAGENGAGNSHFNMQLTLNAVNQAFAQSPYLSNKQ